MTADDHDQSAEPDAPDTLPQYLVEGVSKQDPTALRDLAEYASAMADRLEAEADRELETQAEQDTDAVPDEWDAEQWEQRMDTARQEADVSTSATLTTKTIDGRDYYYLQWREGDSIKNKYVAPVTPSDTD